MIVSAVIVYLTDDSNDSKNEPGETVTEQKVENAIVKKKKNKKNNKKPTPQTESKLFGKWTIINTAANFSYSYEIHMSNGVYEGIIPDFNNKIERLDKRGDKYYVIGSKYGEYYVIDDNMNMSLYDKNGSLSSVGYKAVKK